jgi:hypothetical protein
MRTPARLTDGGDHESGITIAVRIAPQLPGATISSAVTITARAARAASGVMPRLPHMMAFPCVSARWAWTIATSSTSGFTARTGPPPIGFSITCRYGFRSRIHDPSALRVGRNGAPIAAA